ncbi:hypothetical protein BJY04DRAFT_135068 [Aspergillus karnatakaensis]|uniref:uncharacterized protein n=1 Tax=Aspergillus karnatakaensis TaxID=1810916 RepID=UPI003CCE4039
MEEVSTPEAVGNREGCEHAISQADKEDTLSSRREATDSRKSLEGRAKLRAGDSSNCSWTMMALMESGGTNKDAEVRVRNKIRCKKSRRVEEDVFGQAHRCHSLSLETSVHDTPKSITQFCTCITNTLDVTLRRKAQKESTFLSSPRYNILV